MALYNQQYGNQSGMGESKPIMFRIFGGRTSLSANYFEMKVNCFFCRVTRPQLFFNQVLWEKSANPTEVSLQRVCLSPPSGELGRWGAANGKPHGVGCLTLAETQHLGSFREGRAEGQGICFSSCGKVPLGPWVGRERWIGTQNIAMENHGKPMGNHEKSPCLSCFISKPSNEMGRFP